MTTHRRQPLLDLDPDLGRLLEPERLSRAVRELDVEVHVIEPGPWDGAMPGRADPSDVGLLLLDGVISREIIVADTVSTELLGPGDILRMWSLQPATPLLRLTVRWTCLAESRVAVLDRRLGAHLTRWPEVNAALIDRLNDRAQRLATTQAISQLTRVDRRLLALFWHLAERWGRVTAEGVAVPLTLSHRMLGQLVGARRQTISTAIGDLAKRHALVRREDDTWLLSSERIGLPTEEAQRVIPVRRRLYQPRVALSAAEPRRQANHELREACERVRREAAERLLHLQELTDESRRLQHITSRAREQRALDRRRLGGPGLRLGA
jgi:CRP/FNR family transcriptional regulator, cyclic AMP receptor protein